MAEVESVSWLLARQCGICQGLAQDAVSTPCCSSTSCRPCALKHVRSNSSCWTCESPVEESTLSDNQDICTDVEKVISSVLSCCICRETCHRAVCLSCCEGGSVCRGCGIKHITQNRSCWCCSKPGLRTEHLETDTLLRDALSHHKEEGKHSAEALNKLFLRKIVFLKEQITRKEDSQESETKTANNVDNSSVQKNGVDKIEKSGKRNRKSETCSRDKSEPRSSSRDKKKEKKKKNKDEYRREDKRKRKHRSRDRSRDKDRDRDRGKNKDEDSEEKKEIRKENGLGSFAALQRRIRIENDIVEKRVKDKIEEYISSMVTQQLRVRKNEIEKEVLQKVDLARQNMEEEVKLEIDLMRKFRENEEKKRLDEMNARMAEKEKALENERKKLAEDRLAILENQMKIEKEVQKERRKQEKKSKQEQMKILGKDKSRPKLSFTLTKN